MDMKLFSYMYVCVFVCTYICIVSKLAMIWKWKQPHFTIKWPMTRCCLHRGHYGPSEAEAWCCLFKVNHTTSREACGILVGSGPVWSSTDAIILTMSGGHPRSTTLTVEYRGGTFMMWGCFHHQFTPIALR